MSKIKIVSFDQFTLKKAKISKSEVEVDFEENRVIDGKAHVITHNVKAKYIPHPDLIEYRDKLRTYLVNAYSLNLGYDLAIKYLKGEQKQKAEEGMIDLIDKVEVTGISIGGENQLRGCVVSGKIESNNKSKCAMNTPRIVFSSEKLGFEKDVEGVVELIEKEVYKYLFDGKTAEPSLFDASDEKGDVPNAETVKVGETKQKKEPAASGLA
jgi:hypothetical protein